MFAYCNNNPVIYYDACGSSTALPPMIENGLNLPASGGIPVEIDGTTYYYAIDIQNGELYEYWFDAEGNLIWGRHHSTHKQPWKHDNPHDHQGGKDKNGNNTLVGGPQKPNDKFQPPEQCSQANINCSKALDDIAIGTAIGIVAYQIAKWAIATLLAPATGGGSYVAAGLAP